jgi:hypothetical protein
VFSASGLDKVADSELGNGIESDGRFVEEQDFRIVQKRCGNFTAHPLTEGKLSCRCAQKIAEIQTVCQFIKIAAVGIFRNRVNITQKGKRVNDRNIPPKLGSLTEYYTDIGNMRTAFLPWGSSGDQTGAAVRCQNA